MKLCQSLLTSCLALSCFLPSTGSILHHRSQAEREHRASVEDEPSAGPAPAPADEEEDLSYLRPHFGGGPEIIRFGLHCRALSDISIARGTFFADVVTTLSWTDPRAARVPQRVGAKRVTLSNEAARKRIWLPDVTISNRSPKKIEVVSSGVEIEDTGVVTKIDRIQATMKNIFDIHAFPFDVQALMVQLGSTSLMVDELIFEPMNDNVTTGTGEGLLSSSDFSLESYRVDVVEQRDASLKKSRAEFHMRAARRSAPYIQNLLVPELLVLVISFTVFWFPLPKAFAMPRVATALISFLALTTLGLRTNAMLPVRGGLAWIELFETCCQALMFFTVGLNILVLVVYHSFEAEALAVRMNNEMKLFFPTLALIVFAICFAKTDGTGLTWMAVAVNNLLLVVSVVYMAYSIYRLSKHQVQKDTKDPEAKPQEQDSSGVEPPP